MPPIRVVHHITIELDESNGQFRVDGMPANRIIALGMLKLAEHSALATLAPPQQQQTPGGLALLPPGSRLG